MKNCRKTSSFLKIILTITTIGLSACSKQIQDFVTSGAQRPILGEILKPTTSTAKPVGIKISPGANTVQGSAVKAHVAISTTQQKLSGSQIQGTITFNQVRPE